ncbi:hypothetical protein SAMN05428945_6661 [Streptomyces sp. 2224.1]|nr:hypothetical protein BX261_5904 [Streptomyces sp. 2321.6]SDR03473.1 hypothetical protein SAMN05216511_1355 [Streptomyces sp. KS_16]SED81668.1 hypothetical protein SAMN05428940_5931 [Streptomyces sp. 2133.1]SEE17819.1 hypothetical protein SAMN05428945_6661 [Streptomyces sp. 2224.1]SNC72756.1 hypothetical protein SAMN06272741_5832 [Streptomyces sp. 2114.4]
MKSWRTRIGVGLAVSAAAVAIPLTATTASAAPPPGDGWVPVGAMKYPSKTACEAAELPQAQANGYHEVWCDDSETIMPIYSR